MKALVLPLLLAGCADNGGFATAIDAAPPIDIAGHVHVTQSLSGVQASCPTLTARDSFTWTVVDGAQKMLTADPPIVVQASLVTPGATRTDVRVLETDDFGAGTASLDYDLQFLADSTTYGTASGSVGSCSFFLDVHAQVTP